MPMMPSFHRSADEYDEREEDPPEEDRSPQNHEAPGICASLLLVHMDDHWGCGLLYPRMQTDDQLRCCDYHICVTCATMPIIFWKSWAPDPAGLVGMWLFFLPV